MSANAFYARRTTAKGAAFVPTVFTRGPWSLDHQHGGPPAALLAGELERLAPKGFLVAKVAIEFLRPVPLATELTIEVDVGKEGRTVRRSHARLLADGAAVMSAQATCVRAQQLDIPDPSYGPNRPNRLDDGLDLGLEAHALPNPVDLTPFEFPFFLHDEGYHRGVDVRIARGIWGASPITVWMRPTIALIEGQSASALERILICVDAESGVCPPLDVDHFTFVNPDLTVLLERELVGDYLGMSVRSGAWSHGIGLAESALFDTSGVFGRAAQTLVVAPRRTT